MITTVKGIIKFILSDIYKNDRFNAKKTMRQDNDWYT